MARQNVFEVGMKINNSLALKRTLLHPQNARGQGPSVPISLYSERLAASNRLLFGCCNIALDTVF